MENNLEDINEYIDKHTTPESEFLKQVTRNTYLKVVNAHMISGHVQGKFLEMISLMIQPKYILEIGTFTAYSTICLARGLQTSGVLDTIEINDELIDIAKQHIQDSPYAKQINQHLGDALNIIPKLGREYNLVFIDGNKRQYIQYYNLVLNYIPHGGYILVDNVLWYGKVVENAKHNDQQTQIIKDFNTLVANDTRVENILLPIRDGLMLIRKI